MSAIIRRMVPAANLTLLYGHLPLQERFKAARLDGFHAVEILFPYDQSPQWYAQRLRDHGLQLRLVNTPVDPPVAPWGQAALPAQREAFMHDMQRAAEVCSATGCAAVHVMAGCVALSDSGARDALLENLSWASAAYPELTLQLEALNTHDVPGYAYAEPESVLNILRDCAAPNVGMQFDFYHVARQRLDLLAELESALPWIRHVQVAGSPSRNEPDVMRDNVLEAFDRLHGANYRGVVGFEYRPSASVTEGLRWVAPISKYFLNPPTHIQNDRRRPC